ncbi:MAG: hypothetical protein NTW66_02065 [Candidatus Magasanikbacteria bacterium]|nr:hypothetical protein [Candidatus Magasanikbacteria bacterium]
MLIKAGEIIKNSWQTYLENWKKLIPYMLLLFVPNFVLGIAGIASLYLDRFATSDAFVLTNNLIVIAIFVASIIFTVWASMSIAKNLGSIIGNKTALTYKESFSSTSHLIWPVIYTSLLLFLIVVGGTILFIIPGIIFSIWFSFTFYTILFEEKRGANALKASKELVVGRWWAIFWRLFAPGFFYALIFIILSYSLTYLLSLLLSSFTFFIINGLITSILSAVISPLTALTTILLYFSAKENPAQIKPLVEVKK